MGIDKTRPLTHHSIYWINMNTDIGETVKNCPICPDIQAKQPKNETISHEIQGGHGNLWSLTSLSLITSTIFVLKIITANFMLQSWWTGQCR